MLCVVSLVKSSFSPAINPYMTMNRFHFSSSLTALSQSLGIVLLLFASQLVSCGTIDLPDEPKPIEKPHKVTIHTRAVIPESVALPIEVVAFSEGGQYPLLRKTLHLQGKKIPMLRH